jgi:hypothetical protein
MKKLLLLLALTSSLAFGDGRIKNSDINSAAAIVDTKLATISTAGKVSNSATTATNANTADTIVARDSGGNTNVNSIKASTSFILEDPGSGNNSTVLQASTVNTGHTVILPPNICTSGQYWQDNGGGVMSCATPSTATEYVTNFQGTAVNASVGARLGAVSGGACSVLKEYGGDWINGTPVGSSNTCAVTTNSGCSDGWIVACADANGVNAGCGISAPPSTTTFTTQERSFANAAVSDQLSIIAYCPK